MVMMRAGAPMPESEGFTPARVMEPVVAPFTVVIPTGLASAEEVMESETAMAAARPASLSVVLVDIGTAFQMTRRPTAPSREIV
jgi:hypothetical protein